MPYIPEAEVDAATNGHIEENIPGLLDSLSTSSPQKSSPTLLAPFVPVVFVEATDSSLTSDLETNKYEPINVPVVREAGVKFESDNQSNGKTHQTPGSTEATSATSDAHVEAKALIPLDTYRLLPTWPYPQCQRFMCGLENLGNSCFMNSTLQILLHTPQLVSVIASHHPRDKCPLLSGERDFCFTCSLKSLYYKMAGSNSSRAKAPTEIFDNIRKIAPSFRRGRQEDAHEFLRFSIDALQLSAQGGIKDVAEKLAETSWVYRLFGGKFRSRVNCSECNHNSDTFDTLLDLSVDVGRCDTLGEALKKFANVEKLEGKNKYKCEKCNKPVNARKQITVHSAPQALCIQLKRFTPWGRKLAHQVSYPNVLHLNDIMSAGESSSPYRLYGIICHAGGTPNSGHYYAFVQNPGTGWSRMNDEDALYVQSPPNDIKTAYMLFYMREQPSMDSTIAKATISRKVPATPLSGQKRKRDDRPIDLSPGEDLGERLNNYLGITPGENVNPSPAKKPRHEGNGNAIRVIPNVTSALSKSKYSFVKPHPSIPITQPGAVPRPPKKTVPAFKNKDLGLTYGSSEPEDQDDTPVNSQHAQSSQTDATTSPPPPSSLPVSRESSPEPPTLRLDRSWQHAQSTPSSSRTPHDSSPSSSSDSRKRKLWEKDGSNDSTFKHQKSDDNLPASTSHKNMSKVYRTKAKKERREKRENRAQNPYGSMGLPINEARIGMKKNRKPGTL